MNYFKTARTFILFTALATGSLGLASEEPGSSSGEAYWNDSSELKANVGGGASYFNGNTGWGVSAGISKRISDTLPLFLGADLGANVWNFNSSVVGTSVGAWGLSLLPSLIYGFSLQDVKSLRPFVGLAIGPALYVENRSIPGVGDSRDTRVFLEVLVRVGANVAVSENVSINIEPKFGIMGGRFVFAPSANAVFGI